MALHVQQLSTPVCALSSRHVASVRSSASPLLKPWWRSLSNSLFDSAKPLSLQISKSSHEQFVRNQTPLAIRAMSDAAAASVEESPSSEAEPAEVGHVKTKALTKKVKHIMNILNQEAAAKLHSERNLPDLRPGDVIAMKFEVPENKRRVSLIRGIVISKRNAGINTTFRIRRIMAGVGVEMGFPLYSPNIKELKVVDKRRARRAKLYYLRDKIARLSTVN